MTERPYVLSIAGFDPSSGAGITSDIKTFEMNGAYGLGVCTSVTFQNENEFDGLEWMSLSAIINQLDVLFRKYNISVVKIGIVKDFNTLSDIISYLINKRHDVKIIWDPILKASAGFEFHDTLNRAVLKDVLSKIYLVTPNLSEVIVLADHNNNDATASSALLRRHCNVYLKGGHHESDKSDDWLFTADGAIKIEGERITKGEKHGSGCVLSAAIAANLAKGLSLGAACMQAKIYINQFLSSNTTLLGYHSTNTIQ